MSSLSQLRAQRSNVVQGISNAKTNISALEDKITRLQRASSTLSSNITELGSIKSSITSLNIENSRWQGQEKDKFDDRYETYKSSVKNYITKVKEAKETIDEDISRYESTKANYISGLGNLQNTLSSLDYQISVAERER
ncbi:YwqH-like family protein [Gracilibacillus saliphilus]|uniref:YwqH-like family protein n=1 Tax=Gracilibacillus saliphilus TaxID=543890 RepID=UPI0013D43A25|nr:DUF5082 family protein [Gracilibacillus saliphilus]